MIPFQCFWYLSKVDTYHSLKIDSSKCDTRFCKKNFDILQPSEPETTNSTSSYTALYNPMQSWINQFGRDSRISVFPKHCYVWLFWLCISSSSLFRWSMLICFISLGWLCVAWSVRVAATPASAWKWGNRTMASLATKSCKLQRSLISWFRHFLVRVLQVEYWKPSTAPWFRRETAAAPPTAPSSAMKTKAKQNSTRPRVTHTSPCIHCESFFIVMKE